jgi:hypothetical protein
MSPVGHEAVHQPDEAGIVGRLQQAGHFVHDEVFETFSRLFGEFGVKADAAGRGRATAILVLIRRTKSRRARTLQPAAYWLEPRGVPVSLPDPPPLARSLALWRGTRRSRRLCLAFSKRASNPGPRLNATPTASTSTIARWAIREVIGE